MYDVYYEDSLVSALNISYVHQGDIGDFPYSWVSFDVFGIQRELESTWSARIDQEIEVRNTDDDVVFKGVITRVSAGVRKVNIVARDLTQKLFWSSINDTEGLMLLSEGLVYLAPEAADKEIKLVSDRNEIPIKIDGDDWENDEFNDEPESPKYLIVSDFTPGESATGKQHPTDSTAEDDAFTSSGDYTNLSGFDSSFHQITSTDTVAQTTTMKVKMDLTSLGITKTDTLTKLSYKVMGKIQLSKALFTGKTTYEFHIFWSKDGTDPVETLLKRNYAFPAGDEDETYFFSVNTPAFSIADVDSDWFNQGAAYWEEAYIILTITMTLVGDTGTTTQKIFTDFVEIEVDYQTDEFIAINQKISDTVLGGKGYYELTVDDSTGFAADDDVSTPTMSNAIVVEVISSTVIVVLAYSGVPEDAQTLTKSGDTCTISDVEFRGYHRIECYDDSDVVDNFTFGSRGISTGDKFAISIGLQEAIDRCFAGNSIGYVLNNGVAIEEGFSANFKGGTKRRDIIREIIRFKNWFAYPDPETSNVIALKEDDIPAASITLTDQSKIGDVEYNDEIYAWVRIRYAHGTTPRQYPTTPPSGISKGYTFSEPAIITLQEATSYAQELAEFYSVQHPSIPLTWEGIPTNFPSVGTRYNITGKRWNGTIIEDYSYSDLVCRLVRVNDPRDGNNPRITAYFGLGHSPTVEKMARKIGIPIFKNRIIEALDHSKRTESIVLSRTENTVSNPLTLNGNEIGLGYDTGLKLDGTNLVVDTDEIASKTYADSIDDDLGDHLLDSENPHSVDKSDVGLANVTNDSQVKRSEMGVASGVATLDALALLDKLQIPGYLITGSEYQGLWDASTGTYPSITGLDAGNYYRVSVAGTIDNVAFAVNDIIIYNENSLGWDKIQDLDSEFFGYMIDVFRAYVQDFVVSRIEIRNRGPWEIQKTRAFPYGLTASNDPWWIYFLGTTGTLLSVEDNIDGFDNVLVASTTASPSTYVVCTVSWIHEDEEDIVPFIDADGTYYFEFHIKCTFTAASDKEAYYFRVYDSSGDKWYVLITANGGYFTYGLYNTSSTLVASYVSVLDCDDWIHISIAMVRSGTSHTAQLWENEVSRISATAVMTSANDIDNVNMQLRVEDYAKFTYLCGMASNVWHPSYRQFENNPDMFSGKLYLNGNDIEEAIAATNRLMPLFFTGTTLPGGYWSGAQYKNGGAYMYGSRAAGDQKAMAVFHLPSNIGSTANLKVRYFSLGGTSSTYSVAWYIQSVADGENVATIGNNILNGSTAYDLVTTANNLLKTITIPLTSLEAEDTLNVYVTNDAYNAQSNVIKAMWIEY